MGVTGLWNLIEDAGTRVNVETLNQKILAIDLSIWINQSIKGFRDRDGRTVENAHLLGLFYRVCKLLFYQIKPIAVFDGECPTLKLHTVQKRLEKTRKTLEKSKNLSLNVLENYIISQFPKDSKNPTTMSNLRNRVKFAENSFASEFYLLQNNPKHVDVYQNFVELKNNCKNHINDNDDNQPSLLEKSYHHHQLQNIHDIDINSEQFKSLPAVTRYEILVELRDSYKQRKNTCTYLLPQESNSFSQFQMAKLLKKRNLQEEIEKLIQELNGTMGKDHIEFLKLINQINPDLVASKSKSEITTGTLASDEKTRFLLLKTLNQAIEEFTVSDDENNEQIKEYESQIPVYKVPNSLPGESKIESDIERIDFLSKLSETDQEVFLSKQLSQDINKSYKKYSTKTNSTESRFVLSDSDSSSTNSEDFVEVPIDENTSGKLDVFDESVPYDTSYQLDICIDNSTMNEMNKNFLGDNDTKPLEIKVINENAKDIDQIVSKTTEIKDGGPNQVHLNDKKNPPKLNSNQIEREVIGQRDVLNTESFQQIDIDQLIKDSKESAKLNRQSTTMTCQMINECQELLRLFGIPWIVAPAEAEAQCAILEELGFCDGIITDDSDIFLFGGKNVYRNFFTNSKYIMHYNIEDMKKFYGLDRSKFICLGMLCGTDYTLGIDGVGPVTGLEILSQFPGQGLEPLEKFAKWHHHKMLGSKDDQPENSVRVKFTKLSLPSSFPSRVIFDAYYNANVDDSTKPFSWSMPQLYELRQYALERFGWPESKTDGFLLPVIKNLNAKQTQKRIEFYFTSTARTSNNAISEKLKIRRSKRLNEAIRKNIQLAIGQQKHIDKQSTNSKKRSRKGRNNPNCEKSIRSTMIYSPQKNNYLVLSEESSSD